LSKDDTCGQGLIKSEAVALRGRYGVGTAADYAFDMASSAGMISQTVKRHAHQTITN